VFADCGLNVVLLDIDETKIACVNSGQMPFMENSAEQLLRTVVGKKLVATSDSSCLRDADVAVALVGTPVDEHFNLSTPVRITVLELAELVWRKVHGSSKPFRFVSQSAYEYDVQERSPATEKASRLLGFHATTPLSEVLAEVVPWIAEQIELGAI
jgi:nucleoside-diphosphate-sugar epimerase